MSRVFFASDLHFGHKRIHKFRTQFSGELEHREYVIDKWNSVIGKNDKVFVLGDAAFTMESMAAIKRLAGNKVLIRGNHDKLNTSVYLWAFQEVYGLIRYKDCWLSHAPIHPQELRGLFNIHGHVHNETIPDKRYFNACLENIDYTPVEFSVIKDQLVMPEDDLDDQFIVKG